MSLIINILRKKYYMFKHISHEGRYTCIQKLKLKFSIMKKINTLLAVLLFVAGSAFAQSTWSVDKAHSKIGFSVPHMAISEVEGNFRDFDASLVSKSEDFNGAEITFTAKTASIDTDNERRDNHLRSADFFDAAKHPDLTFKGNLVKQGGKYKLKGDLTMHGETKPLQMRLQLLDQRQGRGEAPVELGDLLGDQHRERVEDDEGADEDQQIKGRVDPAGQIRETAAPGGQDPARASEGAAAQTRRLVRAPTAL